MKLFIAEKPSVAKAIAAELGIVKEEQGFFTCKSNTLVTYCFGHMLELEDPNYYLPSTVPVNSKGNKVWRIEDLPITPKTYIKKETDKCKKQIKVISSLIKKLSESDEIVNAGDPDREGQLLVDEIIEHIGYKGNVSRYWQSAMDSVSVQRALKNIESNEKYYNWGVAAQARSQADWLIGMNMTRLISCKYSSKDGVKSVGRVQTPVLALVAKRNNEIENFKPKSFFNLEVQFKTSKSETFIGTWEIPENLKVEGYLLDKDIVLKKIEAINALKKENSFIAKVASVSQTLKTVKPPLLFELADLQEACSKKFGFSAKKTLDVAQELYETHKLTSYPRSSCGYLPSSQKGDVPHILSNLRNVFSDLGEFIDKTDSKRESKIWSDKKVGEEAHTAIIPTLRQISSSEFEKLSQECKDLYRLIAERYIQAFLPDYAYQETRITTKIGEDVFTSVGKIIVNKGWKTLSKQEDKEIQAVPMVEQSESLEVIDQKCKASETKPPKYFTEGSLIKAMQNIASYISDKDTKSILTESDGIGTAATRAQVIQTLKDRGYLEVQKGKLLVLDKGKELLKQAPNALQSAVLTAQTERELKRIQQGDLSLTTFMKAQEEQLNKLFEEVGREKVVTSSTETTTCPSCQKTAKRYKSKFNKGSFYWYCSDCKKNFSDNNGKIGEEIKKKKFIECPECKQVKLGRYTSKKNEEYYFCVNCKKAFPLSDELNSKWNKS